MSLRSFHIIFISVATLLFVLLGFWGYNASETGVLILGLVGLLLIPIYGVYFIKKSKHFEH